jgi:DNA-binding PadR family transcriptional regulator
MGKLEKVDSLGQFEQLVLTAILTLRGDAYGVTIHARVEELAKPKTISLGAVYVTLDRLEDKGLVSSWLSDPTPERGGRAKRCYRLEALGERALRESAVTARRIWDAVAEVFAPGSIEPGPFGPRVFGPRRVSAVAAQTNRGPDSAFAGDDSRQSTGVRKGNTSPKFRRLRGGGTGWRPFRVVRVYFSERSAANRSFRDGGRRYLHGLAALSENGRCHADQRE